MTPVNGISNEEFLRKYASAGRVGLACGSFRIDSLIRRAQRHVNEQKEWSLWSHALIFQGERADGHHWVIESDLDVHHKHIRLGAQENRISKYFDEKSFPHLAVLDFGLQTPQSQTLVRECLEMIAGRVRYSLRELLGTLVALRFPGRRKKENLLSRDNSFYCSAFVQHLFAKCGIDLVPEVEVKRNTPEDLFRSPVPHTTYLLDRRQRIEPFEASARSCSEDEIPSQGVSVRHRPGHVNPRSRLARRIRLLARPDHPGDERVGEGSDAPPWVEPVLEAIRRASSRLRDSGPGRMPGTSLSGSGARRIGNAGFQGVRCGSLDPVSYRIQSSRQGSAPIL